MMQALSEISGNVCPSPQVSDLQNGLVCLCGLEFPKEKLSLLQEEWQSNVPLHWSRHTQRDACPGIHTQPSFLRKTCGLIRPPASTPTPGSPGEEEMEPATWGLSQGAWFLAFHPRRKTVFHTALGKGNSDHLDHLGLGL